MRDDRPARRGPGGRLAILADHERQTHRPARRPAPPPQGRDRGQLRQVPPRAPRRPHGLHAPRPGRRPRRPAAGRGGARLRDRGRGHTSTSSSTRRSSARAATTATSRAASRSRATWPTSRAARRSGSSPRTASARRSRSPGSGLLGRALQHELDHLAGQALHRLPRLDGRAHPGRPGRRGRGRGGPRGHERPGVNPRTDGLHRAASVLGAPAGDRVRTVFLGSGRVRRAGPAPARGASRRRSSSASSRRRRARSAAARS